LDYLTTAQRKALLKKISYKQQLHLARILRRANDAMIQKYVAGCLEHGGNLWDIPYDKLLNEAWKEALDQIAYIFTLKELHDIKE
jgi:hypothetical protein